MLSTSPFYPNCLRIFKQSPLFGALNEPDLHQVLRDSRRETWKSASPIAINPLERFFVVIRGRVELVRTDYASGRDLTLFLLHPGDVFDLVPLLDGKPHALTPISLDQVTLLSVPLASVRGLLQRHPLFSQQLLSYLVRQMRALEDLAGDLTFRDTITRLGELLTHHLLPGHQPLTTITQPLPLIHDLSHETLARMIGSVRVVVSRHIQGWKKNGSVSTSRKHLTILNRQALETNIASIEKTISIRKVFSQ